MSNLRYTGGLYPIPLNKLGQVRSPKVFLLNKTLSPISRLDLDSSLLTRLGDGVYVRMSHEGRKTLLSETRTVEDTHVVKSNVSHK